MSSNTHWTERSTADYRYLVAHDFVSQVEDRLRSLDWKRADLARELGRTEGRVSQVMNNPGNLTLNSMIEYARSVSLKMSVVAYDDGDRENRLGPVHPDMFRLSWERAKMPREYWQIEDRTFEMKRPAVSMETTSADAHASAEVGGALPPCGDRGLQQALVTVGFMALAKSVRSPRSSYSDKQGASRGSWSLERSADYCVLNG